MENNKIERPLILEIDEAKKEIVNTVNNIIQTRGIPFYFLDMVLSEVCRQVGEAAKAELAQAQTYTQPEEKAE